MKDEYEYLKSIRTFSVENVCLIIPHNEMFPYCDSLEIICNFLNKRKVKDVFILK